MGKRTYHLVDPETGKVAGEREVGLLARYGYFSATTRGKVVKWTARVVLALLCLTLLELKPSLPFLPEWVFSFAEDVVLFVVIVVPLRAFFRFIFYLRDRNDWKPVKEAGSYYLLVNPETDKVVGRVGVPSPKEERDDTPLGRTVTVLALMKYFLLHFIAACVVLYFFVPEKVQTILFWIICISSVIAGIVMLLCNYL